MLAILNDSCQQGGGRNKSGVELHHQRCGISVYNKEERQETWMMVRNEEWGEKEIERGFSNNGGTMRRGDG